ncbi:hypothetical protein SAMN06265339_0029 [Desulfurobacterium pacificum]|uniref:SPOR domain-containing protein n=1 Tax=Desulfurobacterium pacificum TaxID=240166 RepID=A0ABY1N7I8_9BACT|nr:SPOR domain-containing protein [Desulfurobacterium pacificum]SMP02148.1 hypothetical protein SAMN06265339_0029 [Desulfurobacterium pacificum]
MEKVNLIAHLEVNGEVYRIKKLWEKGFEVEIPTPGELTKSNELLTGKIVIPYDFYNEIVIEDVKFSCSIEDGKCICSFISLTPKQQKLLRFIIDSFRKKLILYVPQNSMNYTESEAIRKTLKNFESSEKKRKNYLKVITIVLATILGAFVLTGLYNRFSSFDEKQISITTRKTKSDKRKTALSSKTIIPPPQKDRTIKKRKDENLKKGQTYYCIQLATGTSIKDFDKKLKDVSFLPFIRIEKIGKYYSLRAGFWNDYKTAKKFLRDARKIYPEAFIRKCYYLPERWVKKDLSNS